MFRSTSKLKKKLWKKFRPVPATDSVGKEYEPDQKPDGNKEEVAKFFFEAFKPYLMKDVDWKELVVVYKYFNLDQSKRFKDIGRPDDIVSEIFNAIEGMEQSDCFTQLVEAFRECGNIKAVGILEGSIIPKKNKARDLISSNGKLICDYLNVVEILPSLAARQVIGTKGRQTIEARNREAGRWEASFELLFLLPAKCDKWFQGFMEALIETDQNHLAKTISTEYYERIKRSQASGGSSYQSLDKEFSSCWTVSQDPMAFEGRSNSSSEDSAGTGDELQSGRREKRRSLKKRVKSPGSSTNLSDSDIINSSYGGSIYEDEDSGIHREDGPFHRNASSVEDLDIDVDKPLLSENSQRNHPQPSERHHGSRSSSVSPTPSSKHSSTNDVPSQVEIYNEIHGKSEPPKVSESVQRTEGKDVPSTIEILRHERLHMDKQKKIIEWAIDKNRSYLVENLHPKNLHDQFYEHELFQFSTIRDIEETVSTSEKNRAILSHIRRSGWSKYIKFKECLIITDQQECVRKLQEEEQNFLNDRNGGGGEAGEDDGEGKIEDHYGLNEDDLTEDIPYADGNENSSADSEQTADVQTEDIKEHSNDDLEEQSELEEFERMLVIQQSSSGLKCNGSPVQMFEEAVVTLTTKGNVEEYMKPILSKLKNGPTDMAIITDMINILYDHSIKETNFGYTGAQICKYLANELKNHQPFGNFRELFLAKCKRAYDEREAWVADPVTFTHLTNLSMLIGHLFLVLEVEVNGQLEKLGFLRQAISSLLLTFLAQPDDDRIKSAAQLLKLTGFELTKNSHLPGEFEETYNIIRSLEKHPSLNRTSHCLINSVLSRVDHNWGVDQVS